MAIRYWLGVVHRDHAMSGVSQGIAQLNHGARAPLEEMRESDGFVYYSPKDSYPDGETLRAFTAIGRIADDDVYQVGAARTMAGHGDDFRPWRRRVDWEADVVEAPIRPLLNVLDFTRGIRNWGLPLRRGLIELSRHDFDVIRLQMRRPSPEDARR